MTWIVFGLGNPGLQYENTRHNIGRIVANHFCQSERANRGDVVCITPQTYMNESGRAVADVDPRKLIVVHDDLDLPFGVVRVSFGRGSGGHRGVASIIKTLKTENFVRVRIGISPTNMFGMLKKPRGRDRVEQFVLGVLTARERRALPGICAIADDVIRHIIESGYESAMNTFN